MCRRKMAFRIVDNEKEKLPIAPGIGPGTDGLLRLVPYWVEKNSQRAIGM